jgi:hypothetical protein
MIRFSIHEKERVLTLLKPRVFSVVREARLGLQEQ